MCIGYTKHVTLILSISDCLILKHSTLFFRYVLLDVDMSIPNSRTILSEVRKDFDVIRTNAIRLDQSFIRPCTSGRECEFGEISIDETKRKNWKRNKLKKTYMRTQNREK